jgi:hypothetical protein
LTDGYQIVAGAGIDGQVAGVINTDQGDPVNAVEQIDDDVAGHAGDRGSAVGRAVDACRGASAVVEAGNCELSVSGGFDDADCVGSHVTMTRSLPTSAAVTFPAMQRRLSRISKRRALMFGFGFMRRCCRGSVLDRKCVALLT